MPRVPSQAAALIGRHIGDRRRVLAMTQDELAAASGIDSSNIRAYENGRAMPSVQSLLRLAGPLGVDAGDLIRGTSVEMFAAPATDGRKRGA